MTSCFVHHRFQAKGARTYNDDIQGTAAVTVAGILGSLRVTKGKLSEQKVLFFGAGQANIGAAELLVKALVEDGVDEPIARSNVFLFDSKGLVVDGRPAEFAISDDKAPFAAKPGVGFTSSLEEAVKRVKPTHLVGAAAQPSVFTKKIIESMCAFNPQAGGLRALQPHVKGGVHRERRRTSGPRARPCSPAARCSRP